MITVEISYEESRRLLDSHQNEMASLHTVALDDVEGLAKFGASFLNRGLSDGNKQKIRNFFAQPYQCPLMLVRGLPLPNFLPPTPTTNGWTEDSELAFNLSLQFGLYSCFGITPVAYAGENNNRPIRHVVPSQISLNEISSQGSLHAFKMHVDNPHLPLDVEAVGDLSGCPQFLALKCLRADTSVPTNVVLLDDVLAGLPEFVVKGLEKPIYSVIRPDSFGPLRTIVSPLPLVARTECGRYLSRYDRQFSRPNTEEAEFCIRVFESVLERSELVKRFILTPGDVLVFHNQRVLHARDAFEPRFNGMDRWLIRLYGLCDRNRLLPAENDLQWLGVA